MHVLLPLISQCFWLSLQAICGECNTNVKEHRAQRRLAADKGIWKDPNRSLRVLKRKCLEVYNSTNGNTEIALFVYRKGLGKNKLVAEGVSEAVRSMGDGLHWQRLLCHVGYWCTPLLLAWVQTATVKCN